MAFLIEIRRPPLIKEEQNVLHRTYNMCNSGWWKSCACYTPDFFFLIERESVGLRKDPVGVIETHERFESKMEQKYSLFILFYFILFFLKRWWENEFYISKRLSFYLIINDVMWF